MNKKEWLKDEVEEFIRSYQSKIALWDINQKEYKCRPKKRIAIEELALKFDTTPEEITRKIHNLRNQYQSELKKSIKAQKNNEEHVSKWAYFELMSFLNPILQMKITSGCMKISEDNSFYSQDRSSSDEDFKGAITKISNSSSSYIKQPTLIPSKGRYQNNDEYPYFETVDMRDISSSSNNIKEDEFECFTKSIAVQMRQLPLQDALELQAEIQNLVVQKRIKVLNSMRC